MNHFYVYILQCPVLGSKHYSINMIPKINVFIKYESPLHYEPSVDAL